MLEDTPWLGKHHGNSGKYSYYWTKALPTVTRLWTFVVFLLVSFLCLGYLFWIAHQKEKKEQKNK